MKIKTAHFPSKKPFYRVHHPVKLGGLSDGLGMKLVSIRKNHALVRMPWSKKVSQPMGLIHGGALVALVDTTAGVGTYHLLPPGWHTVTTHLNMDFFGNISKGTVEAEARLVHRGRKNMVWEAKVRETGRPKILALAVIAFLILPPERKDMLKQR